MSVNWPPLDAHAHIDTTIDPKELLGLRAVILAASRSLDESARALSRQSRDLLTVWGVGVHPAVSASLENYTVERFSELVKKTAYVGEIGLDGKVRTRLPRQREVLASALGCLQQNPRLTSIHSYGATAEIIEELERTPIKGAILHWWLGEPALTEKAVKLGAYFSVNASSVRRIETIEAIPLDRLLIDTDHPDGNRVGRRPRQPGNVSGVEHTLAQTHAMSPAELRATTWKNLAALVRATDTSGLLPPRVRAIVSEAM
jgi:TatD DNase family protein